MAYIALNRKIFKNVLWTERRPKTRFEAWIDLIQLVSYQDGNKQIINNTQVLWNRGQYPVSRSFLSERWLWSQMKVRCFLKYLQFEQMITMSTTGNITMLTLCNYAQYNGQQPADDPADNPAINPADSQGIIQRIAIIKEVKEDKTLKKIKKKKKKSINTLMSELGSSDDRYVKIAYNFWLLFKNNCDRLKFQSVELPRAKYSGWVEPVRLMIERDKRTMEEMQEVFRYLRDESPRQNGFSWALNIRSTSKLREKFEVILKDARTRQNKDISKVANAVNIQQNVLKKIEEGSLV